jgi:hypothetical protein
MDTAILALANKLAGNNPADIQITSKNRDSGQERTIAGKHSRSLFMGALE